MVVPPPQWSDATAGDPNLFEQGVFSDQGVYGNGKMKMVGLAPYGFGDGEGNGAGGGYGFQPWLGGGPVFEGEEGLMQCGINPSTGEYMTDAEGNARCWYMPVTAGSRMIGGGPAGGMGALVNPDADLWRAPKRFVNRYIQPFSQSWALRFRSSPGGFGIMGIAVFVGIALASYWIFTVVKNRKKAKSFSAPKVDDDNGPSELSRALVSPVMKLINAKESGDKAQIKKADGAVYDVLHEHGFKMKKGVIPASFTKEEKENPEILAKEISCIAQNIRDGDEGYNPFALCRSSVTKGFSADDDISPDMRLLLAKNGLEWLEHYRMTHTFRKADEAIRFHDNLDNIKDYFDSLSDTHTIQKSVPYGDTQLTHRAQRTWDSLNKESPIVNTEFNQKGTIKTWTVTQQNGNWYSIHSDGDLFYKGTVMDNFSAGACGGTPQGSQGGPQDGSGPGAQFHGDDDDLPIILDCPNCSESFDYQGKGSLDDGEVTCPYCGYKFYPQIGE